MKWKPTEEDFNRLVDMCSEARDLHFKNDREISMLKERVLGIPSPYMAGSPCVGLTARVASLEVDRDMLLGTGKGEPVGISSLWNDDGKANPRRVATECSAKPAPDTLTIPQIARRWGVTSLDAVKAVMDARVPEFPWTAVYAGDVVVRSVPKRDTYSIAEVEAVELRLMMPDAVARFIDSTEV